MKATARTWYYLDYQHVASVIKWRMWKLSKILDEKQRNVMAGQGYLCPLCKKSFSTLDVHDMMVNADGFACDICGTLVMDNDHGEEVQKNKDRMQRFNQQVAKIVKCLQSTDKVVFPRFDVAQWLEANAPIEASVDAEDGLAVATGGSKEAIVSVTMAKEGDEEARRRVKEEAAEAKRQANALPSWISTSTVTGELTSAGVKEKVLDKKAKASSVYLRSPGKEKERPKVDTDDADLEAYYAAQAASASASTAGPSSYKQSPSTEEGIAIERPTSAASSRTSSSRSRKRSRELDEGYASVDNLRACNVEDKRSPSTESERSGKKVRVSVEPEGSVREPIPEEEEQRNSGLEQGGDKEPMVSVGGKMIRLADVTEEMEAEMTPEEYTAYADLAMAQD